MSSETLFGPDRVQLAIDRLREFEPEDGYYVAFSGGKDSQVVLDLVRRSDVKYDAHYNWTTVDPPELARFIKREYPAISWERPEMSMWQLIVKKRFPPTRFRRYCCEYLKERGGQGRFVVTGVRWAESARRSRRGLVETCRRDGTRRLLHPIIEWSDADVWDHLNRSGFPHCSLYDEGFKRLGCVMCPMQTLPQMKRDERRWPKLALAYRHAICRAFDQAKADGLRDGPGFENGDEMYDWWLTGAKPDRMRPDSLFTFDN
ncbi:MAG: phosphoadenosine phosphosulfate reductase family protein [Terriglobia bacterium]